jgi:CubicO group peptidase (beta-lactamase class C family)
MHHIHGTVAPKFARLKDVFHQNFADGMEFGSAVAIVIDGKLVVNLWGGHADKARSKPWQPDTLVNVWSVTKAVVATVTAILVERGVLRYDDPIAKHWPEFSQGGKGAITVEQAMSHQAGLDGLAVEMDEAQLCQWTPYVDALAAMKPLWDPGSKCVYHALTYGHLTAETLRRADGRRISKIIQDEIVTRLGIPIFVGLPESEDHRAAEMIEGPMTNQWVNDVLASAHPHACQNPTPDSQAPNRRSFRAAEIPGGNGQTNALALATLFGDLVSGNSLLLSKAGLEEATRIRFEGRDACVDMPTRWGAGYSMRADGYSTRASLGTFGHGGWGGSLAFADPARRIGFAYVTNHMMAFADGIDPRRQNLIEAMYDTVV